MPVQLLATPYDGEIIPCSPLYVAPFSLTFFYYLENSIFSVTRGHQSHRF